MIVTLFKKAFEEAEFKLFTRNSVDTVTVGGGRDYWRLSGLWVGGNGYSSVCGGGTPFWETISLI